MTSLLGIVAPERRPFLRLVGRRVAAAGQPERALCYAAPSHQRRLLTGEDDGH